MKILGVEFEKFELLKGVIGGIFVIALSYISLSLTIAIIKTCT